MPVHSNKHSRLPAKHRSLALLFYAAILTFAFLVPNAVYAANDAKFTPDVLVLVLGGMGSSELVSISYNSVIPLPSAQADLDAAAAIGKWEVRDAKGETKSSGGPKPVPTTSISFSAHGVIGYSKGTLPLEPFVVALKRFKRIEIDYLVPSTFEFHGLKDFENQYVAIDMSPSGNSYRYRIVVKNNGFTKLDLPLVQAEKPQPAEEGIPLWVRVVLAIGLAAIGAALVYLVTASLMKRRNS